jgi:hypothetical protein
MSTLTSKDRVSLCLFTFTDGRRCRTPRTGNHPHFCFYHAQKEARAQAAGKLAKDLACFFSGDYLSACDLSTALSRLIPAVVRGDIKPKLARTVAYMFQTQLQGIHLSQREYINAFGTDGWRKAVRTSVNVNYDYRFPPTTPNRNNPPPPRRRKRSLLHRRPRRVRNRPQQRRHSRQVHLDPRLRTSKQPSPWPVQRFAPTPTRPQHHPPRPYQIPPPTYLNPPQPPTRSGHNPINPTTHPQPHHQFRNPNQPPETTTPTPSTSITITASVPPRNPFTINTYKNTPQPLILSILQNS